MPGIKLPYMPNPAETAKEIEDFILNQTLSSGHKGAARPSEKGCTQHPLGAVVGLSGGVDSSLVAILATRAFERYNKDKMPEERLELLGIFAPSSVNDGQENVDQINVMELAKELGISVLISDLYKTYGNFANILSGKVFDTNYQLGNLISRIRAVVLNTEAACRNYILLGTGNYDEDFCLGYYTLFGDGAVHCSPIGGLPKRLVKELISYLGYPEIANRVPTAGLEPNQSDFKDLGYSYEFAEMVIAAYKQGLMWNIETENAIINRGWKDINKYVDTFCDQKFTCAREMVNNILSRHINSAQRKSQLLHPPAPEMRTLVYKEMV